MVKVICPPTGYQFLCSVAAAAASTPGLLSVMLDGSVAQVSSIGGFAIAGVAGGLVSARTRPVGVITTAIAKAKAAHKRLEVFKSCMAPPPKKYQREV